MTSAVGRAWAREKAGRPHGPGSGRSGAEALLPRTPGRQPGPRAEGGSNTRPQDKSVNFLLRHRVNHQTLQSPLKHIFVQAVYRCLPV